VKIDRHHYFDLVVEEGLPNLIRKLTETNHALADAGLADVDAEF